MGLEKTTVRIRNRHSQRRSFTQNPAARLRRNPVTRPPGHSRSRKEVVVLMLEDHSRNATVMLPILRDADGAFTELGDPGPLQFGESEGRFSGLMPKNKPSAREAAQAKATLLALGMNIVNRGFEPTLN